MKHIQGLGKKEAHQLLVQYGPNEIRDLSKKTFFTILLGQVKNNFILYLLFFAALISFFVGKSVTAYTILAVICMVILIGFIQEYRAEKAVSALKDMLVPVSIVIREGSQTEINSSQLVPGDILILRTGEKVPADCILIEDQELKVNESLLTGESEPVHKTTAVGTSEGDEHHIFMGTYIVHGRCVAQVIHTGMNTKFGKIAGLISTTEKELPLQKKVNRISKYMVSIALIVSIITGLLMLSRIDSFSQEVLVNILILVIALSVSAFPEGFPVVLITTLASGAHRMAKKNALVNRMSIIETLGETTVICSDKTGTITKGEMTVRSIFANNTLHEAISAGYEGNGEIRAHGRKVLIEKDPVLSRLIEGALLCNDGTIERTGAEREFKTLGSPTESALLLLGAQVNRFREDISFERVGELPFSSERKMMSVLCTKPHEHAVYSKGAVEYVLKACSYIQRNDRVYKLSEREKESILKVNEQMARGSLRTIAFAYKTVTTFRKDHFEKDLIFLGLAGMEDPPRPEVAASIRQCRAAGIAVKMITGDNKETALAIAREIGLDGAVLVGADIDLLSDAELQAVIIQTTIFARVKPEHKLRIVNALKANGEVVTMTGDGVNDAPALKEAQIGIAMGKNGTDVSRSVADLTLKDDNFETIVHAIREGRTIFKNIRKFAAYQLSCNFAQLIILFMGVLLAPYLGWQIPLFLALQILFMNLVIDNLPAITLGLNPPSSDSLLESPRKNSDILNKKIIGLILFTGTILMVLTLTAHFISFNVLAQTPAVSRTTALVTLIFLMIVAAFNFRSFRKSTLRRSLLVNPYLLLASSISLIATLTIVFSPLGTLFETVPLGGTSFLLAIGASVLFIVLFDTLKYLNSRLKFIDLDHI